MAILGTLRRDDAGGFAYRLRETARGLEGERNYEVNTDIEALAIAAPGVPKIGDPWGVGSEQELACVALSREVFRIGGIDGNGQGSGGLSRVQVMYGPPAAGGDFTRGLDGRPWTELRFGSETITVKYPHFRTRLASRQATEGEAVPPPFDQIAGGDGAALEGATIEALVHVYVAPGAVGGYLARLLSLCSPDSRVNRDPLVIPRLQGTEHGWTLLAEQARMRAPEVRLPVAGKLEVIVNLAVARDWRTLWQPEDSTGRGVPGVFYADNVYFSGDFAGLW